MSVGWGRLHTYLRPALLNSSFIRCTVSASGLPAPRCDKPGRLRFVGEFEGGVTSAHGEGSKGVGRRGSTHNRGLDGTPGVRLNCIPYPTHTVPEGVMLILLCLPS